MMTLTVISINVKPQAYGTPKTEFSLEITPWNTRAPPWDYYVYVNWRDGTYQDNTYYGLTGNDMPIRWPWTHRYAASGSYDVIVAVRDLYDGSQLSATKTITIKELVVDPLTADPSTGSPPLLVTFRSYVRDGWLPAYWVIDFGDGSSYGRYLDSMPGSIFVQHIYTGPGRYTATLTVVDALGGEGEPVPPPPEEREAVRRRQQFHNR
jgi:PKD repeat protein